MEMGEYLHRCSFVAECGATANILSADPRLTVPENSLNGKINVESRRALLCHAAEIDTVTHAAQTIGTINEVGK
jgi:hypothetical protein